MPFKSEAQRRWMHKNHPEMAKEWEAETPSGKKLPERVKAPNKAAKPKAKALPKGLRIFR